MNPNETKGIDVEEPEVEEKKCASCGMEEEQWTANEGQGFEKDEDLYCCRGCAEGTGCTCEEEAGGVSDEVEVVVRATQGATPRSRNPEDD